MRSVDAIHPNGRAPSTILLGVALAIFSSAVVTSGAVAGGDAADGGERIFLERCASCHGRGGEGVKGKHARALIGDKSVQQLARE